MFTTLTAWGNDFLGQLGDGTYVHKRTSPVEVSNFDGAQLKAIAGGDTHSLAIKDDGTVWAWGENRSGQLGDGTTTNSNTPVQVSDLDGVEAIAAGWGHSLALKDDGTVWAWGDNRYGQLGIGSDDVMGINTPMQVSGLDGVKVIAAGSNHSLAGE
jgi:alpha-tubulin suppressor-like RCC1 family protein